MNRNSILKWSSLGLAAVVGIGAMPWLGENGQTAESKDFYERAQTIISEYDSSANLSDDRNLRNAERALRYGYTAGIDIEVQEGLPLSVGNLNIGRGKEIGYFKWHARSPKTNEKTKPRDVMVYLNGFTSHSGWIGPIAEELVEQGVSIYALDRRGSGMNSKHQGRWTDWVNDVYLLVERAKEENPGVDINLASVCFGTKVASAYLLEHPDNIDTMISFSPGWEMLANPSGGQKIGMVFGSKRTPNPIQNTENYTTDESGLDYVEKDHMRSVAPTTSDFRKAGGLNEYVRRNMVRLPKIPMLMFLAQKDRIVNVPKTKSLLEKMEESGYDITTIGFDSGNHTMFLGTESERRRVVDGILGHINN